MVSWQPSVDGFVSLARKTQRLCDFYARKPAPVLDRHVCRSRPRSVGTELNDSVPTSIKEKSAAAKILSPRWGGSYVLFNFTALQHQRARGFTARSINAHEDAFRRRRAAPGPPSAGYIAAWWRGARARASPGWLADPHLPPTCECRRRGAACADARRMRGRGTGRCV